MAVGEQFVVVKIFCSPEREPVFRVVNPKRLPEDRLPILWQARSFEVLDPAIPPNWEVHVGLGGSPGYLTIAPRTWHRPGFWEDLSDWSPFSAQASADYDRELETILADAAQSR